MAFQDYETSRRILGDTTSLKSLLMAAMTAADDGSAAKLMIAFPALWDELQLRLSSPDGLLEHEREEREDG